MRLQTSWTFLLVLLACTALVAPWQQQLFAQEARGTIVGKIVD